jgi:Bifunctional DNA primase/polymerase, N-terminal
MARLKPEQNFTKEQKATILSNAHACVKRGWYVFPIAPNSKKPFAGTHGFKDATLSTEALEKHLLNSAKADGTIVKEGHDANYGIAIGQDYSGNEFSCLTVLELDSFKSYEEACAWAQSKGIDTFEVRSGRRESFGIHHYFLGRRLNGQIPYVEYTERFGKIDGHIKCNGYVVGPGSIHSLTGEAYTIIKDVPLQPLPDWLNNYRASKQTAAADPSTEGAVPVRVTTSGNANVPEGEAYPSQTIFGDRRHEYLLNNARRMRRQWGYDEELIFGNLRTICLNKCDDGENYWRTHEASMQSMIKSVCGKFAPKAVKAERTYSKSTLAQQLDFRIPVGATCDKKQLHAELTEEGFYNWRDQNARKDMERSLKTLGIQTVKRDGKQFYVRPAALGANSAASPEVLADTAPEPNAEVPVEAITV